MTEEIKGAAGDMAREARAAGEAVRQEVSNLGGTIKQGLSDQVERQKNGIADRLSAVAERAQTSASDLRAQEAWLGNLLGRGADELASIAEEIRRNDVPGCWARSRYSRGGSPPCSWAPRWRWASP